MCNFTPDPTLYTIIASFSIAVLAVFIPFTTNTISNLANRFGSEVASKIYDKKLAFRILLPLLLASNIILPISFYVFQELLPDVLVCLITISSVIILVFSIIFLFQCLEITKKLVHNTKYILKALYRELDKKVHRKKNTNLIPSIEDIGDLLVYVLRNEKKKLLHDELTNFVDRLLKILQEKLEDPDPESIKHRILLRRPETYYPITSTFLNQIKRLKDEALKSNLFSNGDPINNQLQRVLRELTNKQNNNSIIKVVLNVMTQIGIDTIQKNPTNAFSSIDWYTKIVFETSPLEEYAFRIDYIDIVNQHFFTICQAIVRERDTSLFSFLLFQFIDGIPLPDIHQEMQKIRWAVWGKATKEHSALYWQIHSLLSSLISLAENIYSLTAFNEWKQKCEKVLTSINNIDPSLDVHNKKATIYKNVSLQLRFNLLLKMVNGIAAYCLFSKEYDYIVEIWGFKQPRNSTIWWGGNDIYPNSMDKVILLIAGESWYTYTTSFPFFANHQDSEFYYRQYYAILILRYLPQIDSQTSSNDNSNVNLSNYDQFTLRSLQDKIDDIEKHMKKIFEEEKNEPFLRKLGIEKKPSALEEQVQDYLSDLRNNIDTKLEHIIAQQPISQKKVSEFKECLVKAADQKNPIRTILNEREAIENKTDSSPAPSVNYFSLNKVSDKAAFFEKWHVNYDNRGQIYGDDLGISESRAILQEIIKHCEEPRVESLNEFLSQLEVKNDYFICAIGESYSDLWRNNNFTEINHTHNPPSQWAGELTFNELKIPVYYSPPIHQYEKGIVILNKNKFGKLIQWSPVPEGESSEGIVDRLWIDVRPLSEDHKALEDILKDEPNWLKEYGSEEEKRNYLKTRVHIRIYERFELQLAENFEGYFI